MLGHCPVVLFGSAQVDVTSCAGPKHCSDHEGYRHHIHDSPKCHGCRDGTTQNGTVLRAVYLGLRGGWQSVPESITHRLLVITPCADSSQWASSRVISQGHQALHWQQRGGRICLMSSKFTESSRKRQSILCSGRVLKLHSGPCGLTILAAYWGLELMLH